MTAFINALDDYTSTQFGENGHVEYGWSNSIEEKIIQISFQVTRTNQEGVERIQKVLNDLLSSLKYKVQSGSLPEKELNY